MRRYIKDESVDLVYLDPPFNSNQDYNVLFAAKDGRQAAAQIPAFEDSWGWDEAAARQYEETVERGGKVSEVLQAFRLFLGTNDMLAYLTMMAPRLVELQRVLKPTGCLYLHCDPTASHYLKAAARCGLRTKVFPQRDHLEADERPPELTALGAGARHHPVLYEDGGSHLEPGLSAASTRDHRQLVQQRRGRHWSPFQQS